MSPEHTSENVDTKISTLRLHGLSNNQKIAVDAPNEAETKTSATQVSNDSSEIDEFFASE